MLAMAVAVAISPMRCVVDCAGHIRSSTAHSTEKTGPKPGEQGADRRNYGCHGNKPGQLLPCPTENEAILRLPKKVDLGALLCASTAGHWRRGGGSAGRLARVLSTGRVLPGGSTASTIDLIFAKPCPRRWPGPFSGKKKMGCTPSGEKPPPPTSTCMWYWLLAALVAIWGNGGRSSTDIVNLTSPRYHTATRAHKG